MEELTFRLENFEGPLDLLLALIQKHKMDLHHIPIFELIEQYTRVIREVQREDMDVASEFIEMAAHLVEMKSCLLLPRSEEGQRMKEELTGRLIEYELCRQKAAQLAERRAQTVVAVRQPMELSTDKTYRERHAPRILSEIWRTLVGRAKKIDREKVFEPLVTAPFVSVGSKVVYILRNLVRGQRRTLKELFSPEEERSASVATFLALLELMHGGRIAIEETGEVTLQRRQKERRRETDGK